MYYKLLYIQISSSALFVFCVTKYHVAILVWKQLQMIQCLSERFEWIKYTFRSLHEVMGNGWKDSDWLSVLLLGICQWIKIRECIYRTKTELNNIVQTVTFYK